MPVSAAEILQEGSKLLLGIQWEAFLHQLLIVFPKGRKADVGHLDRCIRAIGIDGEHAVGDAHHVQGLILLLLRGERAGSRDSRFGKLLPEQHREQCRAAQLQRDNGFFHDWFLLGDSPAVLFRGRAVKNNMENIQNLLPVLLQFPRNFEDYTGNCNFVWILEQIMV